VALFDEHPLSDLDKKAHEILGDKVVVKSLAQQAAFQGLPRYVSEYLIAKYVKPDTWKDDLTKIQAKIKELLPNQEAREMLKEKLLGKGEVTLIEPPRRIAFTYILGGDVASLVTITLDETELGTLLHLHHALSSAKLRDGFVQGWRYQLALFSKAVAEEEQARASERVDAFLSAWGEPDPKTRRALLESCATPGIVFRDAFSATDGLDDMLANLDAIQIFMPGMTLVRSGDVRQAHGTAIAPWIAKKENGDTAGAGTNVFDFAPDGRIARVVGFWGTL